MVVNYRIPLYPLVSNVGLLGGVKSIFPDKYMGDLLNCETGMAITDFDTLSIPIEADALLVFFFGCHNFVYLKVKKFDWGCALISPN